MWPGPGPWLGLGVGDESGDFIAYWGASLFYIYRWLELRRLPPDHGFCVSKYSLLRKNHIVPYKGACSTQRHGVSARAGDPSCLELH